MQENEKENELIGFSGIDFNDLEPFDEHDRFNDSDYLDQFDRNRPSSSYFDEDSLCAELKSFSISPPLNAPKPFAKKYESRPKRGRSINTKTPETSNNKKTCIRTYGFN